jgi:hypothetical protein
MPEETKEAIEDTLYIPIRADTRKQLEEYCNQHPQHKDYIEHYIQQRVEQVVSEAVKEAQKAMEG